MTDTETKIEVRPFRSLGAANHGWLDAHHHFSFADYYDPARMNWGAIRVWNDDIIQPAIRFSSTPPCRYGNRDLCPYGCHHSQGQSWK